MFPQLSECDGCGELFEVDLDQDGYYCPDCERQDLESEHSTPEAKHYLRDGAYCDCELCRHPFNWF